MQAYHQGKSFNLIGEADSSKPSEGIDFRGSYKRVNMSAKDSQKFLEGVGFYRK